MRAGISVVVLLIGLSGAAKPGVAEMCPGATIDADAPLLSIALLRQEAPNAQQEARICTPVAALSGAFRAKVCAAPLACGDNTR